MASAPLVGQFLVAINGFIKVQNQTEIKNYLILEPPFGDHYARMIVELRQHYPKGSEDTLEQKCTAALTAARDGVDGSPSWTPFIRFMVQYFGYLRDVDGDPGKYLDTYKLLSELQARANSALVHPSLGRLILPVVISCAKAICRLAIGLDKNPELIANLGGPSASEPEGPRESLPERAVNILRNAFTTCLNDRSSGLSKTGVPEGKKRGIYTIANICLKALFQSQKTRNAKEIFESIGSLSPPLCAYPKSERVTYLYYLGRFLFQNSHFYRAAQALQEAYNECPANDVCARQRRLILIFLITSNLILGRFPSVGLLSRREAQGLQEKFMPIMLAIRTGNLVEFHRYLSYDSPNADWFLKFRILLQLRNRCEPLVWRSLIRKIWLINGIRPKVSDGGQLQAPQVNLEDLVEIFEVIEEQVARINNPGTGIAGGVYVDPDFAGVTFDPAELRERAAPDLRSVESKIGALHAQGLMHGYVAHNLAKFVILGAKEATNEHEILEAGFPRPWAAVERTVVQRPQHAHMPGWKKGMADGLAGGGSVFGPGMVLNLSGARPVGAN